MTLVTHYYGLIKIHSEHSVFLIVINVVNFAFDYIEQFHGIKSESTTVNYLYRCSVSFGVYFDNSEKMRS